MRRRTRVVLGALSVLLLAGIPIAVGVALRRLSFDHEYRPEYSVLPEIRVDGDSVWIRHVRAFRWAPDGSAVPGWTDRAYDVDDLRRVWFAISPFAGPWQGPAHTFLSFEFEGDRFLAVSVEARKEAGEDFSPLKGLMHRFELMYVIGDEPDLVGLRAVAFYDPVYLYPGRATPDQIRRLFLAVLRRASEVGRRPEFYNTIANNCTTNLARAINEVTPGRVPWSWRLDLPGYSDKLALKLGLLDTDLPLDSARRRYRVDDRVRVLAAADSAAFSVRIRGG